MAVVEFELVTVAVVVGAEEAIAVGQMKFAVVVAVFAAECWD